MIRLDRAEVLALAKVEAEPAVSVLLPVHRAAARHDAARRRATQLLDQASDIVQRSYPDPTATAIVHRLRDVANRLDLTHPGDGLAVYVSADEQHVLDVPFPVTEQLTIEDAFATRQLLVGLAHRPAVLVLVLSEHLTRLFEDHEGQLIEVQDRGFPIATAPASEVNTPQKDRPIHEDIEAEEHRIAFRAVDAAIERVVGSGTVPLVVVAAARELAYFDAVSRHRALVVGRVPNDLVHSSISAIEHAVRPAIDAYVAELEDRAVSDVLEGMGTDRVATDFTTVWHAAMEGRGHRLVIEEDFTFPLHLTDGLTPGPEPDEPWTLDDAVDELIERVIHAGGEVTFVRPGALAAAGGIGLVLQW